MAITKKFKKEMYDALANGLAYRFDHKKKQDRWSTRDVGVYGMASIDIFDEYLLPVIQRHLSTLQKKGENK